MASITKAQSSIAESLTLSNALTVVVGSLLIAISAQFSITLPFISSLPFTLQNHCVFLLAALLGPKKAFAAVALYLCEGASGLPVFTHGRGGLLYLLGPHAGYLFSYLPASLLIGKLFEKYPENNLLQRIAFIAIGNGLNIFLGTVWLSCFIGIQNGWIIGAYPFLATCMIKTVILALSLPLLRSVKDFVRP